MDRAAELDRIIGSDEAELSKPTQNKAAIGQFVAEALGVQPGEVYAATVSKPGNIMVRLRQSAAATRARIAVELVTEYPFELDRYVHATQDLVGQRLKDAVVVVGRPDGTAWSVVAVVERPGSRVAQTLLSDWPDLAAYGPATTPTGAGTSTFAVPLVFDDRTTRMARLAVATSPAVFFVGPPGTGKNYLLKTILEEISADPESYGLSKARECVIEPAEEGWTARDLVGGETVDETSQLRFRPGRVLDAIAHDRWICIDEANRADLDKIFGALLTWLSYQDVVVGRASTAIDAPLVRLRWTDEPGSYASGVERLDAAEVGTEPIDYFAGNEFRLLGTYNGVDAARVFRFGLALGRRFAQVPVPPASVAAFRALLESRAGMLADGAAREITIAAVEALYSAHMHTENARLGPAMFLTIPDYVATGLRLRDLGESEDDDQLELESLIAEGYLLATGAWLARLETAELRVLGASITASYDQESLPALPPRRWDWVCGQLSTVGG
jgi:hypothetical protein